MKKRLVELIGVLAVLAALATLLKLAPAPVEGQSQPVAGQG